MLTNAYRTALVVAGVLALPAVGRAAVLQQFRIPATTTAFPGAEAIVAGPDGALWFTEPQADRIGRITTSGVFTAYPITPGSGPIGIAAGPDGALWFTEARASRIGRITTAGAVTEYPATPGAEPLSIAPGPDGALWFTEPGGNRIGRIATDGTVAEYPLTTSQARPTGITAGPDGGIWFTEAGAYPGGRIGRIDPATLSITEVCGSTHCAGGPAGIVAGRDGALWFTEQDTNKIGRLTVAGALIEFDAPLGPFGLTFGRDGALWYTESGMALPGAPSAPGEIGRLTAGGTVEQFPLLSLTSQSPNNIVAGPDGSIWIAERTLGTIERLTGSGPLSLPVPVLGGLSMTRRAFRVPAGPARPLTAFRFTLSTAADVNIDIEQRHSGRLVAPGDCVPPRAGLAAGLHKCVYQTRRAYLASVLIPAGHQRIAFTGRDDNGRRLPPGSYQATAVPLAAGVGVHPRPRTIRFTVLR